MKRNHIELFAGCGGLSLGLEKCGFEITLVNELSPMASESFAYNLLNDDLDKAAEEGKPAKNVLWINSKFKDLKSRLRENPFEFPEYDEEGFSDLPDEYSKLKGKLLVGSIVDLNKYLTATPEVADLLKTNFGDKRGLDLVSGGPPCQSFSMAGLREKDSEKNSLPWEFAKFVQHTQPKVALLENVTGILRPFKDQDGNAYHAWYEVAKAFAMIGYVPLCLHINARFVGIPQNRPRFIMLSIRHDHLESISGKLFENQANANLLKESISFYKLVSKEGENTTFGHLNYFDVKRPDDQMIMRESFLSPLVGADKHTVSHAIDDLKSSSSRTEQSEYVTELNSTFDWLKDHKDLNNNERRRNSELVIRRFRIYQVLSDIKDRSVTNAIFAILRGETDELSEEAWEACQDQDFRQADEKLKPFHDKASFIKYLQAHPTKKQTQKALIADQPAPAALSIPDDGCHYDKNELRVLTVREMARIQSFPDNFVFRSKVTTGGQMRKFEVPQYTQVGNAVPPLLGLKLGECIEALLK